MGNDATLEILLQAKNQSEAAFKELRQQLGALQAEIGKTARAAESGLNFDKLKAGAVGAAAAVYGAFQTISKAVDMAEMGAKLERQSAAFGNLATAAGTSSQRVLSELKQVSRGLVSEADLMAASGKALLMGIPAAEITKLMEIAAATSRMTGQTMTEAFSDITMGVARQSRMILDNLGIIVDADKAYGDYAKTLGKAADALTDTEKRQAFMNAVMKSGEDMIKRLGSAQGSLEGANKLIAAQKNLWDEVGKAIARISDDSLTKFARELTWIEAKLKGMREAAPAQDKQREWNNIERVRASERFGLVEPGTADRMLEEFNRKYVSQQYGLKPSEEKKVLGSYSTKPWNSAGWKQREGNWGEYTADELKAMKEEREKYLKEVEEQAKKEQERIARIWADYKPRYAGSQQSEAELADQAAFDAWKRSWEPWASKQRLPESQRSEAELADEKAMEEYKEKLKKEFSAMTELSAETARAMQSNFSNLFFDAMTGELKSFEDYATAIFRSIQRAFADMAGQMLTQKIFGTGSTGGTSGGGGWLSDIAGWIGGLFGSGSTAAAANGLAFSSVGVVPFARGGIVSRPTVFPFANGGVGVMGEEGPEAVMPLKRMPDGRLGVSSAGGSTSITINVAAPSGRVDRDSISQLQTALYSTLQRAGRRNA